MYRFATGTKPGLAALAWASLLALVLLAAGPTQARAQSARFDQFTGTTPKAGEMAPAFQLITLDNEPFDLMAVAAEMPVVIEFGSFT